MERLARPAKAGHAGTLDPLATGVLIVCLGAATRLIEYVQQMPKKYRGHFLLGQESDTEDCEGTVRQLEDPPRPSSAAVAAACQSFLGEIEQLPPKFSALKIGGRRAYRLARAGRPVELQPRTVRIDSLEVVRYDYPDLVLDVVCGSGTYIRSLGRDLARALGTEAVTFALTRTAIGPFQQADALNLATLDRQGLEAGLIPAVKAVPELMPLRVDEEQVANLAAGRTIRAPEHTRLEGHLAAVDQQGQLVAIVKRRGGDLLGPVRNFPRTT